MKKFWIWFSSIIGVIVLGIILIYIFASVILGHVLTSSFGTKTTVSNSAITLNSLRFWDLQISNPPKTKYPYALTIENITVEAPLSTYFTNFIQIEEITLSDLTLVIEILPGGNKITNWDVIMNHINESSKDQEPSTKEALIKILTINNLTINMVGTDGQVRTTKIPSITFKNLNTKEGNITSQIVKTIIFKMIFNPKNIVNFPLQYTKDSYNKLFKIF